MNLVGILTPGERVPAVLGNQIVFRDGVPMCSLESGNVVDRINSDDDLLAKARDQLFISHAKPVANEVPVEEPVQMLTSG